MSCCAIANPCSCQARPRRVVTGRPVCVEKCDPRLAVQFAGGCLAKYPDVDAEDITIRVFRAGDPSLWADYRSIGQDSQFNWLFQLDDAYFDMPPGRYLGAIEAGCCCYLIQLELPDCGQLSYVGAPAGSVCPADIATAAEDACNA